MGEKPFINGLLKGLFGRGRAEPAPALQNPLPQFPIVNTPPVNPAAPKTEAYLSRKKGRKVHEDGLQDMKRIVALIESRGEATPGELAQELGMARSTLTYNLKRLMDYSRGAHRGRKYIGTTLTYFFAQLLAHKRVERLGAGQSVRYRIVQEPPKK